MGFLNRFFFGQPRALNHADLGLVKRTNKDVWLAESAPFPTATGNVTVALPGSKRGPDDKAVDTLVTLRDQYQEFGSALAAATFEFYLHHTGTRP